MSILLILGARYGPGLTKALYGLVSGDPKAIGEVGLKWTEKRLDEWAKDREKKQVVDRLRSKILDDVASAPELCRFEDKLPVAQSLAADTFESAFSLDYLFECVGEDSRLPASWLLRSTPTSGPIKPGQVMRDAIDEDTRSLHDAILRATAASLVRHFDELPNFHAWFLRRVRQEVRETRTLRKIVESLLSAEARADIEFERKYLESVQRKFDVVELFVERPDLPEESQKQRLSVAYVTLDLSVQDPSASFSRTVSATSLLDGLPEGPKRVLCLGPAGSGKTTLMRWMGIEAARPRFTGAMKIDRPMGYRWRDCVPFLIRLRQFKDGGWPGASVFHEQGIDVHTPPPGWADRIIAEGRAMLLVDGLDELRPERRKAAIEWIKGLVDSCPTETVLAVTSRPQALDTGILSSAGFQEFAVRDLSPSAQRTFVDQWHAALALYFSGQSEKLEQLQENKQKLLLTLDTERAISVLARNPLICALMCALNRLYRTDLPKNLPDLCSSACKMLLWDRDSMAEVKSSDFFPKYTELSYPQRLHLAQSLAYNVVKAQVDTITRTAALEIIRTEMYLDGLGSEEVAEEVLKGLVERSNLLRDAGDDELEFAHNTLRDYLASAVFARRREKAIILRGLRGAEFARWEPVARFSAASEVNPGFGVELLSGLLKPTRVDRKLPARQEVFALKLLGSLTGFVPYELRSQVAGIESRFLPVSSPERAKNLAAAGEAAIEHLTHRVGIEERTAAAMVEALGRIEAPPAKEALETWLASDHRPKVLDSLAYAVGFEALSKLVNLLTVPLVLSEVTTHAGGRNQWGRYVDCLDPIALLENVTGLSLGLTRVSDLSPISSLKALKFLFLDGSPVVSLEALGGLTSLEELYLAETLVADLRPLVRLDRLRMISLFGTRVTDLSPLSALHELSTIWISIAQFSTSQLAAFRVDHPQCSIRYIDGDGNLDEQFGIHDDSLLTSVRETALW